MQVFPTQAQLVETRQTKKAPIMKGKKQRKWHKRYLPKT